MQRNHAAVRCCSMDGKKCESSEIGCPTGKTYSEALSICKLSGLRLCTKDELHSGVCCGTGCQFDNARVWSSNVGKLPLSKEANPVPPPSFQSPFRFSVPGAPTMSCPRYNSPPAQLLNTQNEDGRDCLELEEHRDSAGLHLKVASGASGRANQCLDLYKIQGAFGLFRCHSGPNQRFVPVEGGKYCNEANMELCVTPRVPGSPPATTDFNKGFLFLEEGESHHHGSSLSTTAAEPPLPPARLSPILGEEGCEAFATYRRKKGVAALNLHSSTRKLDGAEREKMSDPLAGLGKIFQGWHQQPGKASLLLKATKTGEAADAPPQQHANVAPQPVSLNAKAVETPAPETAETPPPETDALSCDQQRGALQSEYEKSYEDIVDQQKDAYDRVEYYPECKDEAKSKALGKLGPLTQAEEASEQRAMDATHGMEKVGPVLSTTQEHLKQMAPHLDELKQECLLNDAASAHLKAVRTLIMNMAKCPAHGGFDLALPAHVTWDPNA